MFDINDKETIMKLIDKRKPEELIIPLYVRVGKDIYSLLEIRSSPDCSPSIFKVGFGSSNSVFTRLKFPTNMLMYFSDVNFFNHYDEDKQATIQYIVFESSDVEDNDTLLNKNINMYYDMLLEYVMENVDKNKKERIKKTMEELSWFLYY